MRLICRFQAIFVLLSVFSFFFIQGFCEESEKGSCLSKEEFYVSEHSLALTDESFPYKATVGSLLLKKENCEPKANISFISYERQNVAGPRPITFCFNGGPGSSSVWLHLGLAGPKRIAVTEQGLPQIPYHLEDNTSSLLDVTDLVFIDPISTGFSRAIPPESAKDFYSVKEDIKSIAEFIQLYLSRFNRWESPKFLMGESYGTTRACALAEHLRSQLFIDVDGLVLISAVLNFQTIDFKVGNDLPFPLFLPTYTASAWYHHQLDPSLQKLSLSEVLDKAKEFAATKYSQALFHGDLLSSEDTISIIRELSTLTGLSPSFIENCNLRVPIFSFAKELLRSQKRTVGRFDARIKGIDSFVAGGFIEYDPSLDLLAGAITSTFNYYLRNDLGCPKDSEYKILTNVFPWDYSCDNAYFNVSDDLRATITSYPAARVFVASGYYDLATPFFATEYTVHHLQLDPSCQHRVTIKNYEGGHMMYSLPSTLVQMKKDLTSFYKKEAP